MLRSIFASEHHSRLFAKGDIKYVILDLLKDRPSYGYEIMHSLEERFHGFYSPSAGSVYPTLQMLEDIGYVISLERDGEKVYTISEEGRRFLTDHKDTVHGIKSHMRDWGKKADREELHDAFHELRSMAHLISRRARQLETEKLMKVTKIITEACHNIEDIIEE